MNQTWRDKGVGDMIHNRPSKADAIRQTHGDESAAEYERGYNALDGLDEELQAARIKASQSAAG